MLRMRRLPILSAAVIATAAAWTPAAIAQGTKAPTGCTPDNAGLKLPAGFCAGIYADSLPGVRHIAVAANGDVFVSMMTTRTHPGGIVGLRDTKNAGHADKREQFASGFTTSEVRLFNGHLYTEAFPPAQAQPNTATISVLRYPVKAGELTPSGAPDTVVQGLPGQPGHSTRNFVITNSGVLYLNIGSPSNSCQQDDRKKEVPGKNPCEELDTRAGIWQFDANKTHQTASAANHYARGIRNAVGMALDPTDNNKLWVTQHGRDQLGGEATGGTWPNDDKYNAENPAEELVQPNKGDDFGWPYCYYAPDEKHLILAPEYGGDKKKTGQCAQKKEPVAVFPAHWAPNGLMFYTGSSFPAKYKNGAFIAFHGSWNRAPEPQAGFNVVFQPVSGGKSSGSYEVFADGFAASVGAGRANASQGTHRPTGLAMMNDGSLLVADDMGGRVYRIVYTGK
jgi:glucose/arabinose dehydrogenase